MDGFSFGMSRELKQHLEAAGIINNYKYDFYPFPAPNAFGAAKKTTKKTAKKTTKKTTKKKNTKGR